MIHEPSTAVLLLVLLAMVVVVQQADSEKDEELDPFDMVNFDHVKMKMKKVYSGTPDKRLCWWRPPLF